MTRFAIDFGCFDIDPVPGQPQAAHCHGFVVWPSYRGQGLAHELKAFQIRVLKLQGYDYATCTVASNNEAQKRVLDRAGWTRLAVFRNRRTEGATELWGYEVTP